MKWIYFYLAIILFSANTLNAQAPTAAATKISKYGEVISFSADLSQGGLIFRKVFRQSSSGIYVEAYTLISPAYNNGKPFEIQLNRQSFDAYFKTTPELWAIYSQMIKRSQDRNLSFTDEKGWTALMEYYNISMVK